MASKKEFEREKKRHASGESTLSTDSVSHYIPIPPDGGYGWVIVFASFMNHVVVDGIAFTFGVFMDEFTDYFGAGKAKTAMVGSLMAGCYLLSAPVAGALVNKIGCRPVSMIGAVISAFGFAISTLSTSIDMMMLTYGFLGGTGLGILYLPNVIAVSYYFQQRRALATGIAVCGAGVGCFILAPLGEYLITNYAWKSAVLVVAGITLNGAVFAALLMPLRPPISHRRPRSKTFIDRWREKAAKKTKLIPNHSDNVEDGPKILEKVQNVKLARERALSEEESDVEADHGASVDDVTLLNHQSTNNCTTALKIPTIKFDVPQSEPSSPAAEQNHCHVLTIDVPMTKQNCDKLRASDSKLAFITASPVTGVFQKNTSRPVSTSLKPNESNDDRYHSEICVIPSKMAKLPRGVHRDDFARPMYRRDIFYSGSILHIDEFHSSPNIQEYTRSMTSVPGSIEPHKQYKLCHCIPISKSAYDALTQMTDLSLLKNPIFLIPCLANMLAAIGLFVPFVYIVERAESFKITADKAAFLVSVIGITNTIGRLLAGFLADLKCVNSLLLHNVALIGAGVLCFINMFCVEYISMCIFAALFGLCIATWISLTSIVLCNLLGLEKLTNAFGLLTMTRGVATLVGSPLAGVVYDKTKNFDNSFHVGGAMMLTGGLLLCLLLLPCLSKKAVNTEDLCKADDTDSLSDLPVPYDDDKVDNDRVHRRTRFPSGIKEQDENDVVANGSCVADNNSIA